MSCHLIALTDPSLDEVYTVFARGLHVFLREVYTFLCEVYTFLHEVYTFFFRMSCHESYSKTCVI